MDNADVRCGQVATAQGGRDEARGMKGRNAGRIVAAAIAATLVAGLVAAPGALAVPQDDGGSGGDAGDTFETATAVVPRGPYSGRLEPGAGDRNDFYRFFLAEGGFVTVLVTFDRAVLDPAVLLDPAGRPVDAGTYVMGIGASANAAVTTQLYPLRVAVHRALVAGEYRLHLQSQDLLGDVSYELCFMNCEDPQHGPIEFVFGGSLPTTDTQVLLVPPSHGDLGNPAGPTVIDYLGATLRGIHRWTEAMSAFADDHPEYAYLRDVDIEIEVFDGLTPVDPAGYDVIIGYVAAGPVFRGVASNLGWFAQIAADENVHFSGRVIALSLFGASPRAGQVLYDYPEVTDLEVVTMHEFAHTFGLGHTRTWDATLGPDLMNSPATFVYGDGFPLGDGGERTTMTCISSLDLYGMAELYAWVPSGQWQSTYGNATLPAHIPYTRYC